LSSLQVQQIQARSAIDVSSMQVNSLMGMPLDRTIRPGSDAAGMIGEAGPEPIMKRRLTELNAEALKRRPEVRATELRRESGVASVGAARAGWFPSIYLTANYDYARPNQRIIPPKDRWDETWDVGVNVQWNLWDWMATKHQTAQAEAALRQTEAALTQVQDAVMLDVAQNFYSVQAAHKLVDVAQDGVAAANETFRITDAKFKQGVASNTEVLDAQTAAVQAQITLTQARVDLAMATARLTRALGLTE
jgi:outer membrane protein TolC